MITLKTWGIVLALAANLLIAGSLGLQKWVHLRIEAEGHSPKARAGGSGGNRTPDDATSHPLFWCAIVGLILGEAGNFTAFGLASPTVVSPRKMKMKS